MDTEYKMATKDTITNTNNVLNNLYDVKDKLTDKEYKDLIDGIMELPRFVKIKYLRVDKDADDDLRGRTVIGNYRICKNEDSECCLTGMLDTGKVSQRAVDMYFEDEGNTHPVDTCCNVVCILQMWKF